MTEPWKVTVVDTGSNTMTGGRVKRIQKYIGNESFFLTYGDGVSDVNIKELLAYHNEHKKIVTITSVSAGQKFGVLDIEKDNLVKSFREKNNNDGSMINAGYMVCEPELFKYIPDDSTVLERKPFETIASEEGLIAYRHTGFWHCMDTKRDKDELEKLWTTGKAPWKVWD